MKGFQNMDKFDFSLFNKGDNCIFFRYASEILHKKETFIITWH